MSEIPTIGSSGIPKVGIGGPSIIPTIDPPVIYSAPQPVSRSVALPVFSAPDPSIKYPVINVPTQEEFDAAVAAEKKQQQEEKEEKSRGLPDTKPSIPQLTQIAPPVNSRDISEENNTTAKPISAEIQMPILGAVPIPTNKEVALAGTTAMAATAAALLGKSAVDFLLKFFKPIANQIWIRGKKLLSKDLTDYELQLFFAFEKEKEMKVVAKKLKKEFKLEKQRQYKESKK